MAERFLPLEDVFKTIGIPTHTFVEPVEYARLLVALRTAGKSVIVEGPSGIGKTTSVTKALSDLGRASAVQILKCRNPNDVEMVGFLPEVTAPGVVMIDDFHVLAPALKKKVADFVKLITDEERTDTKIIILGINLAGQTLVEFAPDLTGRIERLRMETNTKPMIEELFKKGQVALNLEFSSVSDMASEAIGSFHLAQMIGYETCISNKILVATAEKIACTFDAERVRNNILNQVSTTWHKPLYLFARGSRPRREGRAPYLQLLYWLAIGGEWSLDVRRAINDHAEHRLSVGQIVDKGYLETHISDKKDDLAKFIHYDPVSKILSIEDPKVFYYLRHLNWSKFAGQCGFSRIKFDKKYDFALSFAGSERAIARSIFEKLTEDDFAVFYDENEQARMVGNDLEAYFQSIYSSDAEYVLPIISPNYPERVWTKFESDQFKARFGDGRVIPILIGDYRPTFFDELSKVGHLSIRNTQDPTSEINSACVTLKRKISDLHEAQEPNELEGD
jgi:hypothetical protein